MDQSQNTPQPQQNQPSRLVRFKSWVKRRRVQLAVGAIIFVALVAAGVVAYLATRPKPEVNRPQEPMTVEPEPVKPTTKPSPLTGVELAPEVADRPVYGVIIENHPDARPQSGLGEAGVVYEALAEGGITRFLAFFLENQPAAIGPVRSLRTYFVSWGMEFDTGVAHAGGNADAIDLSIKLGFASLNQFHNAAHFYRATDRFAPHNLYTNASLMGELLKKKDLHRPARFAPSPRKPDSPANPAPHQVIKINYSFNGFQVEYRYDPAHNDYVRFMAGKPHLDRNTGGQIRVKNIVVEYMPIAHGVSRLGEQLVRMGDSGLPIGRNKALVFRDGTVVEGTWNKADNPSRTKLLDATGADIPLNAGNTWYSIVPVGRTVTY